MSANLLRNRILRTFLTSRLYPALFQSVTAVFFVLVVFQLLVGPSSAHDNLNESQPYTHDDNLTAVAEPTCVDEPEPMDWPHKIDMDAIFPPGEGRDLVLWNCMNCHTFVRIVTGHHSHSHGAEGPGQDTYWDTHRILHRARLWRLSEEELDVLYAYLKANFNDSTPEPKLPCWLGASYW